MSKDSNLLTKADLISLGFSKYLTREVCKGLASVSMEKGTKAYTKIDLKNAIVKKLSQDTIKPLTRENLQVALSVVSEKSNLIEVDFLRKLSSEERIRFLNEKREKLRLKGEEILQDVDRLLKQAKQLN